MTEQEIYKAAKNYAKNKLGIDDDLELRAVIDIWFTAIDWYQKQTEKL